MDYISSTVDTLRSWGLPTISLVFLSLCLVSNAVYTLAIHPLAKFPGPWWAALSRLPFCIARMRGDQVQWMHSLHLKYGPVVRFCPDELSYVDQGGSAWKAIYGQEKGVKEFPRIKAWYVEPFNG